jgi:hypothetical protein
VADDARAHVTFSSSAGGSLKQALRALGRREEVLYLLADDLAIGPLEPTHGRSRRQWAMDEIGFEEWPDGDSHDREFWDRLATLRSELVVWISRRYVTEYCGFLEVLRRVKHVPINVVDVADVELAGRDGALDAELSSAFSVLSHERIVANGLYERAARVTDVERERYEKEWERLRRENGALRVRTDAGVVSVPLSHFDATILSFVTDDWRSFAKVIATTMGSICSYRPCSDELFFCRLLTLIESGVIEGRTENDFCGYYQSHVRRLQRA